MRYISLVEQVNTLVSDSRKERLLQLAGYRRLVTFLALSAIAVCGTVAQAQVTGKVFRDYNADGFQNTPISSTAVTAGEQGVPGVIVTAYPVTGSPLSATTDINGAYSFVNAGITAAGNKLRLEFSGIPSNLFSGPQSTTAGGSGTIVQFVTASSSTTANLAVNDAAEYCQTNPKWATGCYVNGLATGTDAALVVNNYNASGFASGAPYTQAASTANIGSTWGLAYSRKTKRLFAATYLKRHVGMADGPGFIYYFNFSGSTTPTASAGKFDLQGVTPANGGAAIDLGTVCRSASCSVTGGTSASFVLGAKGAQNIDYDAFLKVGTISYGDADVDEATGKLWVVNLNQKALISVDISGATLPGAVNQYPLSTIPGFPACTGGKARPFALAFRNGVGYVGVVCDAGTSQNKADLHAYVLSFDPANPAAGLTSVLDFNLGYKLLTQIGGFTWNPWLETILNGSILPQPMLSDIEFAPDNSMILGLRDRWGDQQGPGNFQPNGATALNSIAAGDILKACYVNGAWIMEGLPGGCPVTATAGGTGVNANGEFFKDTRADTWDEGAEGGLALLPGTGEVVTTFIDPWNGVGSPPNSGAYLNGQGLQYFSTATGSITDFYQVYSLYSPFLPLFGKAEGLSDLQFLCDPAPIEIGNRVWLDKNKDGIQSPDEVPLAGVTVQLFAAGGSTPLATTVTDANGLYVFKSTSTTALTYNTAYEVRIPTTQSALTSLSFTTPNVGTNNGINSDFVPGTTAAVTSLTTGDLGQNVHTFDAGLICDAPTLAAIPSQSICQGGSFAFPLTASVTSGTATGRQWYLTDATGSSFTAIAGATSLTFTPTGTNLPTATGGTRYYAVSAYNSTTACSDIAFVSLTIKPTQTITFPLTATTLCGNTKLNTSVTTNAKAPDAIKFVYFTSPLASDAAAYTATGGTVLGTVNSGTAATNTVSLNNTQLPDNVGGSAQLLYVYALLESADGLCKPVDSFTLTLSPRPAVVVGGNTIVCQGGTTQLTAAGPTGTTFQWFLNNATTPVSPANNPFTTTAISTTTTYRIRGTLAGCVSDEASIALTPVPCTPCALSPTSLGGVAYRDFNSDGAQGTADPGLSNVTVTIFRCDASNQSSQVAQMQTDINGAYSFTGLTVGTTYRVEFSNLPTGYSPTYRGTQNGTTVQFTQPGSCSASLGLNQPVDYCQANPYVAVPCYVNGNPLVSGAAATSDALVTIKYDNTGAINKDATASKVGSVWGLAWNPEKRKLFSAAFLKRHVGLGPNGLGAIYVTNYATDPASSTVNTSLLIDLATITNLGSVTTNEGRGIPAAIGSPSRDIQSFTLVGKAGLGDIDLTPDGKTLFAANLNNRSLLAIDLTAYNTSGTLPGAAQVSEITIPHPGCPNGVSRPFALKAYGNKLYVGLTCTAENGGQSSDLSASVLVYNLATQSWDATPALSFPLDYVKGSANASSPTVCNQFKPWTDVPLWGERQGLTNGFFAICYPTPLLSDIEFDSKNGSMILGFIDRSGHQWGYGNYSPNGTDNSLYDLRIAGDILRAAPVNGGFVLESAGRTLLEAGSGTSNNQGPGGGEYYVGDNSGLGHNERSMGGLAHLPGSDLVMYSAMDVGEIFDGGVEWLSNRTGATVRVRQLYQSPFIFPNGPNIGGPDTGTQGKANGLGDLELLCDLAPIQIGNRVWRDDNQNGIQDPCEPAIPGAVVRLYNEAKTTVIASATTNAAGEYYFSSTTITAGTSTSSVSTTALQYSTTYGLVITSLGTSSVVTGLSLTNVSPLTPGENGAINSGTTLNNNDAKVDVVGGISSPCIKLTTGGPGETNHTYDFGITIPPCVLPVLSAIPSQSVCQGTAFTLPLTSSVVSGTYTSLQWFTTDATGTVLTPIAGATSLSLSLAQAAPPTTGGTKYYALIAQNGISALCSTTVLTSLYMKPAQTITFLTPGGATLTQCANTTLNLSVSTNAKAPDAIRFVYFTSPLPSAAAAYTATGGTVLGTVNSGTATTNTVSLNNVQLPDNVGSTAQTLYVYALLQSADGLCLTTDMFTLTLTPRPVVSIGGDAIFCQGTTTQLTALGVSGGSYQWFLNNGTTPVSPLNPYPTPVISTTTTYQVRATLAGCVSDLASYTLTPVVCTSCAGGTATVGGRVYQDFNSNGTQQADDRGVAGVTVTIFRCDASNQSSQVAQMQTDINGAYSFTGLTPGTDYRVEFTNLPAGTQPTYRGTQNGTTVQFTKPGSCSISLGINYPSDFCQANPKVVVPCYENGTGTGSIQPGFVSFDYGTGTKREDGTIGEVGSVWGVAYQRTARKAFTSAFLKRHVGFAARGPGGIYVYDYANPAANAPLVASFSLQDVAPANGGAAIDLGSVTRVTSPATDPNYISTSRTAPNYDIDAFAKVGKMSYGDADVDETNNRLWLVNLNQRAIISLNISGSATSLNGASPASLSPLTNQYLLDNLPGVPNCGTDGVFRPWALAFHRGKGYLGGVCSSETSKDPSKLVSYVLEFDPNNVAAGFTTVMDVPMTYPREQLEGINPALTYRVNASWRAWLNAYADIPGAPASPGRLGWPQPMLSDIAFADNGDMVMGFTDRLSHQWGMGNYLPVAGSTVLTEMGAGGDILHACFVNGKWLLEGTAGSCKTNDILNNSGYRLANDGPSKTGEFYPNDYFTDGTNSHYETANGGLVILPGQNEVITTAFDITSIFQQGVKYFSTTTGATNPGSFAIIPNTNGVASFGKGNGLGDLEITCDLAPIQIGNRVWRDDNQNGIQDPCEPPIAGAVVKLYDATKTTVIASATTNAAGEYYFSSATVVAGTSTSAVSTSLLTYNTTYGLVITSLGSSTVVTAQGLTLTDVSPVTPGESGAINSGTSQINNDAKVDVVGGVNLPCIKLTTGGPGETNHTYDFGFYKFLCNLTVSASASSQTIATGQSLTLTALATGSGSYTYAWSGPAGVVISPANAAVVTASNLPIGINSFTATVTSGPGCFSTVIVSVSVFNPPCTNGLGGIVFNDFNNTGVKSTSATTLSGIPDVTVTVFDCQGNIVGTATTDATGRYSFPTLTASANYPLRVEFSNLPTWARPTANGTDGRTDLQFVPAPDCTVDYGVVSVGEYCQASPKLITACYVNGTANATTTPADVIVSLNYLASGTAPAGKVAESEKSNVGSVWGLAYARSTQKLFAATFLKRHVGIKGALGDIYVTTVGGAADGTLFVTIPNAGTIGTDASRGIGAVGGQSRDLEAFGKVGRVGLGGLAISDDEKTLYTVNLNSKELVTVDVATSVVSSVAIPTIFDLAKGKQVPFAVKYWRGKVYVGLVADASISQNRADLDAAVLIYDPATASFSPAPVLTVGMDYLRRAAWDNTGYTFGGQSAKALSNKWYPWVDTYDRTALMVFKQSGDARDIPSHPTPILSDIEFDASGNMILGFADRIGHLFGDGNITPDGANVEASIQGGGILKAVAGANSTWTVTPTPSTTAISRFFTGDFFNRSAAPAIDHGETSSGGLYYSAQNNLVALTVMDPIDYTSGGLIYLSNSTGAQTQTGAQLYIGNLPYWGKSTGIADVTGLCNPLPVEVGNRVWIDANQNGVQDPCAAEPGVAGIKVNLYDNTGRLVGKTTTTATGEYYFNATNVATQGVNVTTGAPLSGTFTGPKAVSQYCIVFGNDGASPQFNITSATFSLSSTAYKLTVANSTASNGNDQNDSDAAIASGNSTTAANGFPTICLTTPDAGANHTFDLGLAPDICSLTATASASSQTVAQGQALTLTAQATPAGSYTYAWAGSGTITPTNAATVTASNLATGLNTFTVTVTSAPGCFTTAVVSVSVVASPVIAVTVTPGVCQTATNQYSISGALSLTNAVAGNATITDGTATTTVTITAGATAVPFTLSGFNSGTGSHTVTVSYASLSAGTTYTAPVSCTVAIAISAIPDVCQPATNQYSISGTLSLTNAVAGTATITDGTSATTVTVTAGATLVPFTLGGFNSGTGLHTVSVSYAGKTANVTYTAPISCTAASCQIGLNPVVPLQSACNDNGTANVSTDDYFTVTINATATNGGASGRYEIVLGANADGTGGAVLNAGGTAYGTAATVGTPTTFKADGATTYVVTVRDINSPTCKTTFTTTVVQSCSNCPPQLCIPITGLKQ